MSLFDFETAQWSRLFPKHQNLLPQTWGSGEAANPSHLPDLSLRTRLQWRGWFAPGIGRGSAAPWHPASRHPALPHIHTSEVGAQWHQLTCGDMGCGANVPRVSSSQLHTRTVCRTSTWCSPAPDTTSALLFPSINPMAISQLEAAPSHSLAKG